MDNVNVIAANPTSSGWIVGGLVAVVGATALYFALKPKAAAADTSQDRTAPPAAQCTVDQAKLTSWGVTKGLTVYYQNSDTPTPVTNTLTGMVVVTRGGDFYTFTGSLTGTPTAVKRDDLRDAYCSAQGAVHGHPALTFMAA